VKVRVKRNHDGLSLAGQTEYLHVFGAGHFEFTDVLADKSRGAQQRGGVPRDALIEKQPENFERSAHATGVSSAMSSRLAAAKASACRISSASNSG